MDYDPPSNRIQIRAIAELRPYPRNARKHSPKQVRQVAASIERFGFTIPILIDETGMILAGHCRVSAAKHLGWREVPCIQAGPMTEAEKKAYILADNQLTTKATWDIDLLQSELGALQIEAPDLDITLTGFTLAEIDTLVEIGGTKDDDDPRDDVMPQVDQLASAVTRSGDLWLLGDHRLICGDARDAANYAALLTTSDGGGELAEMVITDAPYNVRVDGNVMGLGSIRHREFAMASGEMSQRQFRDFLHIVCRNLVDNSKDGSIHFLFMDWRHNRELQEAADDVYTELKNVITWVKDIGGMGSFYRSRHEWVFAYKNGTAPHINTFELGQHGRTRTNVWNYRGINSGGKTAREELAMHPTVKPTQMIADAIRDCSRRGGIVLDAFCGSGTILVAAEKTGRKARAIELDTLYCDTAIRRWQAYAKDDAILAKTGETFAAVEVRRNAERLAAEIEIDRAENVAGPTDPQTRLDTKSAPAKMDSIVRPQSPWSLLREKPSQMTQQVSKRGNGGRR